MNEPFSFGAPERQRFTMQFGYNVRPSLWQNLQSNAHLVIAAVGTVALLGVAGVALWLCVPGNNRQVANAATAQTVPTIPVKTMKIAPAATTVTVAAAPQAARKADAVSTAALAGKANVAALASNSPRWTTSEAQTPPAQPEAQPAPTGGQAATPAAEQKSTDTAFAEPAAQTDASTALAEVAAPAAANDTADAKKPEDKMDGARTAAIPETQPQVPDAAANDAAQPKPKAQKAGAAANGRILRAVTMRSGPKKGAGAITTVPAKASVQVMSCNKWCEIVYNGKRGWVYKTYVKTGA